MASHSGNEISKHRESGGVNGVAKSSGIARNNQRGVTAMTGGDKQRFISET